MFREKLREKITTLAPAGVVFDIALGEEKFGDYATNVALVVGKQTRRAPEQVGGEIVAQLKADPECQAWFSKIELAGPGFVNFYLSDDFLRAGLKEIIKSGDGLSGLNVGQGQKVIVEYSCVNIAKRMHIGHIRSTILGDALANIYQALGYQVVRWNYLGDWGTQFGKLIAAYKKWGDKAAVEKNPIETLQALYVRFHEEMKDLVGEEAELDQIGQKEFHKLEEGDPENLELWKWFRTESLKEFNKTYKLLGIKFDVDIGESFYEKELQPLVEEMEKQGLAKESKGAIIVDLEKYKLTPALLQKSDGSSLYMTRDIANLRYRLKEYSPNKILYVVGNAQALHFDQLFTIASLFSLDQAELIHVKFGMILGEDRKKLATREGKAIPLEDLISRAVKLTRATVEEKNHGLTAEEKDMVAQMIGIGALKYEILREHRNTDIIFDWKRMLDFSGNSGPYLQYTYARLMNIISKAGKKENESPNFDKLTEGSELTLIKRLLGYPYAVLQSQQLNQTNGLALYLYELANQVNRFYETVPVLKDDDDERMAARLVLIEAVGRVLKNGLALLGITAPARM